MIKAFYSRSKHVARADQLFIDMSRVCKRGVEYLIRAIDHQRCVYSARAD
jgi:hypothetical protein